jgi:hypothetical protein
MHCIGRLERFQLVDACLCVIVRGANRLQLVERRLALVRVRCISFAFANYQRHR